MRAPVHGPAAPARHRRAAQHAERNATPGSRLLGRRWLPVGVVVAVAAMGVGVLAVDYVSLPEVSEPSLLAVTPPTPDAPVLLAAPAGGDAAEPSGPAADPTAAEEASAGEASADSVEPAAGPPRTRLAGNAPNGLPWRSGLVVGPPSEVLEWEDFRGRHVDVVHAYTARDSWEGIETADWILDYYADTDMALVIAQPFWPEGSGGSLGACASGAYDSHWATYGRTLVERGRTDAFTRLAWEFNGDWFEWSATDPSAWKACFRSVVEAVRSTAPDARFEWNMNAHGSQTSDGDAWKSYPGNDVVDVVGIDPYDHYPSSPTPAAFDEQCRDNEGLCTVIDFARANGKGVGVTEWGVIGGDGGGDNPVYMEKMYETFTNAADVIEYETYFNDPDYGNSLVGPDQNPASSNVYLELWGS